MIKLREKLEKLPKESAIGKMIRTKPRFLVNASPVAKKPKKKILQKEVITNIPKEKKILNHDSEVQGTMVHGFGDMGPSSLLDWRPGQQLFAQGHLATVKWGLSQKTEEGVINLLVVCYKDNQRINSPFSGSVVVGRWAIVCPELCCKVPV